jgi:hypothetical protein
MHGEIRPTLAQFRGLVGATLGAKLIFLRVAGLVLLGRAAFALFVLESPHNQVIIKAAFGAFALLLFELATQIAWLVMHGRPWRYVITDAQITVEAPKGRRTLYWDDVQSTRVELDFWVLKQGFLARTVIPRAAFSHPDAVALDELIARRGSVTAR